MRAAAPCPCRIVLLVAAGCLACGTRSISPDPPTCLPEARVDSDRDGHLAPPCGDDCDDTDASLFPGAADPLGDDRDTDCDGVDGTDRDRDGVQASANDGEDCDDTRATIHPGANDNQGWVVENIPDRNLGGGFALAVDAGGVAHLAGSEGDTCAVPDQVECENEGGTEVYYVTNRDGGWTWELLDAGRVYPTVGIAIGPQGEALVSYPYTTTPFSTQQEVRLVRCGGLSCTVDVVAQWTGPRTTFSHDGTDVDLGTGGQVLVGRRGPLNHAFVSAQTGQSWRTEFESEREVASLEMAADPSEAYLAFMAGRLDGESGFGGIWLARRRAEEWEETQAASLRVIAAYGDVALALDRSSAPHVAYSTSDGLYVAKRRHGDWTSERVADGWFSGRIAMAADSTGTMHLVWTGPSDQVVHHATDASGDWVTEGVAPGTAFPTIAIDASDTIHLAFTGPGGLRYATFQPVDGVDQNCDGVDGVDADGDGHASRDTGGDDPDDQDPAR